MVSQIVKVAKTIAQYFTFRNELLEMGFAEKGGTIKVINIVPE